MNEHETMQHVSEKDIKELFDEYIIKNILDGDETIRYSDIYYIQKSRAINDYDKEIFKYTLLTYNHRVISFNIIYDTESSGVHDYVYWDRVAKNIHCTNVIGLSFMESIVAKEEIEKTLSEYLSDKVISCVWHD